MNMSGSMKHLNYKLCKIYRRFIHVESKQKKQVQWLKPTGYETNVTVYNPIAKCKVPLISKNKNLLTWYVCGPTVYDSAHIGHAATYVKSDIIRRILTDHFNINIVMAMCITNIDDKIIMRSRETKQNYKDLAEFYENEFIEDMKTLNVMKPHLYCRVTDYIPQIIQFVNNIVEKGDAYVAKGSVYFETSKYNMYGKLSTPCSDGNHPDKKSALDFSLWKAAKEGEPFWESPWGRGRPGWHIECSTIASTVFGNSVDIHSGGIDLAFPHHENEEAQSCSYHEVEQWVNYWLHCGHLFLENVKMSKSLKNTISIREFLKKHTANQLRMLCLLSNYKAEIKYSEDIMSNAVNLLNKVEHFIHDCDNYTAGRWSTGNVDEVTLLRAVETFNGYNLVAIATAQNIFQQTQIAQNLTFIKAHLQILPTTIKTLGTVGLPITNLIKIDMAYLTCIFPYITCINIRSLHITLSCLDETMSDVNTSLADDFNTAQAMRSLMNLVDTGNKMLHDSQESITNGGIPVVAAASNYISTMCSKLGISYSTVADEHRTNTIIEYFVKFRNTIRNRALEQEAKDKILLAACDEARLNLLACGITIKDFKSESTWSVKKY